MTTVEKMKIMLTTKDSLFKIIPQRPPIVMVDGLLEHTEAYSVSQFEVLADNIFVLNGSFQLPGLVENIAQTAALRAGYGHMQAAMASGNIDMKPPIGFIGEVKNLKIHFLPAVGAILNTRIDQLHQVFNSSIIKGAVMVNGEIVAECEMKIFAQP